MPKQKIQLKTLSYHALVDLAHRVGKELVATPDPRRRIELRRAYQAIADEHRERLWVTKKLEPVSQAT